MLSVDKIRPLIEKKMLDLGFELFDLRFFRAGTHSVLRIAIDSAQGITIQNCELASREISALLDNEGFSPNHPYTLEVSSPGIDRPLKTDRDYNRIIGRDVVVHLSEAILEKKTLRGKVVKCENSILMLDMDNKKVEIPLSNIFSGKEKIRFK